MTDITFILPGIRPHLWPRVYNELQANCNRYKFEVLAVGPEAPEESLLKKDNFKFTQSFEQPTVCIQKEALKIQTKLMSIICDDCIIISSIDKEIDRFLSLPKDDIICLRYTEGFEHSGHPNNFGDFYWTVWYHPWHHAPGIPMEYKIAPVQIMRKDLFIDLGGLDCTFEVMSMCIHDFAYRAQNHGSNIHMSENIILSLDRPPPSEGQSIVEQAFFQHDLELYRSIYREKLNPPRIKIDVHNYKPYEGKWKRRFNQ